MLKRLSRKELLILAAEVQAIGDQNFLDRITDEFKRRNKGKDKNE